MSVRKKSRRAASRKTAPARPAKNRKKKATKTRAEKPRDARASGRSRLPAKKKKPAARKPPAPVAPVVYGGITSEAVQAATGRTWDQWLTLIDKAGAADMTHRDIAEFLHVRHDLSGWWSQMITVGYEQARGRREKHEKPDGFQISGSKTVTVPLERLFGAWNESSLRARWLGEFISIRKATPNKSMRITWSDGRSHVDANFYAKGEDKSMVSVQHGKLPDARTAEKMKEYWSIKLERMRGLLETA